MAFPTTLSTLVNLYHGGGGPFLGSNGAVYFLARSSSTSFLHMFKATSPDTSFEGAGVNPEMLDTIRQLHACQVGDTIHVVTRTSSGLNSQRIHYHAFDMATDAWTITNELVKTTYTIPQLNDESVVRIVVRSDGDKIILYEGPQQLSDVQRARVYYARHLGTAWSADVEVSVTGNLPTHFYPAEAVLGSADRIHFFFHDYPNNGAYQRCLTSANALESQQPSFATSIAADVAALVTQGVAYSASAGGTVVRFAWLNSFGPNTINDIQFTSVDAPGTLTLTTNTTSLSSGAGSFRNHISMRADGATVYATFEAAADDLYVMSSQDAGAWSSPLLLHTGQVNGGIFTNILTRPDINKVLGIIYRDSAGAAVNINYTEYTLSVVAAVASDLGPSMALLGVGR